MKDQFSDWDLQDFTADHRNERGAETEPVLT